MVDAISKNLAQTSALRVPSTQDTSALRATKSIAQTLLNGSTATAASNASRTQTLNAVKLAKDASPPPTNLPRGSIIDELV